MIVHGEELVVPAHLNFGKFVIDRLRKANPDAICWIDITSGEKLSYGSFTQHAVSVSAALTALGVARGDAVAVAGEPRAAFMPTALAVVLAGAAFTPLEMNIGRAILLHKLNLSKPKFVICSRLFWEAYRGILEGLDFIKTFICFDDIDEIKLSVATMATRHVDVTTFEPVAVKGQTDVAMVAYSSGTTGMSKGVLRTHLNFIAGATIPWYPENESLQTMLLCGGLSNVYNNHFIFYCLTTGKRIVYTDSLADLKTLQDYQVNIMPTAPVIVKYMVTAENVDDYDLSSLKIIYSCCDRLHPAVIEMFKQRYPHVKLLQWYGMTETGMVTAARKPSDMETTIGVAGPGVTLKVVDVQTRATLGPHQRGEICARGPCLMQGYLGAAAPHLDEQGFYLTGDLGYYDDHEQFYFVDRMKDVISYIGFKVPPLDVESVLLAHPAVRDAAVVGKPAGDLGELPTAFVVLQPGAQATSSELLDYTANEVSWQMQLRGGVRFVSEIPMSSSGRKVERRRLREMLELEGPQDKIINVAMLTKEYSG